MDQSISDPVEHLRLLGQKSTGSSPEFNLRLRELISSILTAAPSDETWSRRSQRLHVVLSRPENLPFGSLDAFADNQIEVELLYDCYLHYSEDEPLLTPQAFLPRVAAAPRGLSRAQWRALVHETGLLQILAGGRFGPAALRRAIGLAESIYGWCSERSIQTVDSEATAVAPFVAASEALVPSGPRFVLALPLVNLSVALQLCMLVEELLAPNLLATRVLTDEAIANREKRFAEYARLSAAHSGPAGDAGGVASAYSAALSRLVSPGQRRRPIASVAEPVGAAASAVGMPTRLTLTSTERVYTHRPLTPPESISWLCVVLLSPVVLRFALTSAHATASVRQLLEREAQQLRAVFRAYALAATSGRGPESGGGRAQAAQGEDPGGAGLEVDREGREELVGDAAVDAWVGGTLGTFAAVGGASSGDAIFASSTGSASPAVLAAAHEAALAAHTRANQLSHTRVPHAAVLEVLSALEILHVLSSAPELASILGALSLRSLGVAIDLASSRSRNASTGGLSGPESPSALPHPLRRRSSLTRQANGQHRNSVFSQAPVTAPTPPPAAGNGGGGGGSSSSGSDSSDDEAESSELAAAAAAAAARGVQTGTVNLFSSIRQRVTRSEAERSRRTLLKLKTKQRRDGPGAPDAAIAKTVLTSPLAQFGPDAALAFGACYSQLVELLVVIAVAVYTPRAPASAHGRPAGGGAADPAAAVQRLLSYLALDRPGRLQRLFASVEFASQGVDSLNGGSNGGAVSFAQALQASSASQDPSSLARLSSRVATLEAGRSAARSFGHSAAVAEASSALARVDLRAGAWATPHSGTANSAREDEAAGALATARRDAATLAAMPPPPPPPPPEPKGKAKQQALAAASANAAAAANAAANPKPPPNLRGQGGSRQVAATRSGAKPAPSPSPPPQPAPPPSTAGARTTKSRLLASAQAPDAASASVAVAAGERAGDRDRGRAGGHDSPEAGPWLPLSAQARVLGVGRARALSGQRPWFLIRAPELLAQLEAMQRQLASDFALDAVPRFAARLQPSAQQRAGAVRPTTAPIAAPPLAPRNPLSLQRGTSTQSVRAAAQSPRPYSAVALLQPRVLREVLMAPPCPPPVAHLLEVSATHHHAGFYEAALETLTSAEQLLRRMLTEAEGPSSAHHASEARAPAGSAQAHTPKLGRRASGLAALSARPGPDSPGQLPVPTETFFLCAAGLVFESRGQDELSAFVYTEALRVVERAIATAPAAARSLASAQHAQHAQSAEPEHAAALGCGSAELDLVRALALSLLASAHCHVGAFELARDCALVSLGLRELHLGPGPPPLEPGAAGRGQAASGLGASSPGGAGLLPPVDGAGPGPALSGDSGLADIGLSRNNLGVALHGLGEVASAMFCFREAHDELLRALGPTHPRTAAARFNLLIEQRKPMRHTLAPGIGLTLGKWTPLAAAAAGNKGKGGGKGAKGKVGSATAR